MIACHTAALNLKGEAVEPMSTADFAGFAAVFFRDVNADGGMRIDEVAVFFPGRFDRREGLIFRGVAAVNIAWMRTRVVSSTLN